MKRIRHLALAGCSLVLLTQCATQDEVRDLHYQLRAVNQKLEDVKSNTVNRMQRRQASSVNKIDRVESETLRLKGLIEESAHQSSQTREQAKEDIATLQTALAELVQSTQSEIDGLHEKIRRIESQLAGLTSSYDRLQRARVQEAELRARKAAEEAAQKKRIERTRRWAQEESSMAAIVVRPSAKKRKIGNATVVDGGAFGGPLSSEMETFQGNTPPKSSEKDPSGMKSPSEKQSSPLELAIGLYKAGKYQQAYQSLEELLVSNPQGHTAALTLFYMGECFFAQGEYDLAILDYQKVISNHAQDSLAPKALLKQGMSFEKITDIETAKIIYNKLLKEYAKSSEAGTARRKLESL
ncbi:MAG: hypothetical protein CSA33_02610 [Desulfobulbus propionicus]|nr:MAG: hypothetical protein CSA33_02610 [Desulfobulbus propionicus]